MTFEEELERFQEQVEKKLDEVRPNRDIATLFAAITVTFVEALYAQQARIDALEIQTAALRTDVDRLAKSSLGGQPQ